jgi:hypothetical protein
MVRAVSRDELLADPDTLCVDGCWEVICEQIYTQRDGSSAVDLALAARSRHPPICAVARLLPSLSGQRASSFSAGMQFRAKLAYYPAPFPLRAAIAERLPCRLGFARGRSSPGSSGWSLRGFCARLMVPDRSTHFACGRIGLLSAAGRAGGRRDWPGTTLGRAPARRLDGGYRLPSRGNLGRLPGPPARRANRFGKCYLS